MTKELSIEVVQRQCSRILGGSSLKDLAPLLSGEPEVYLVYDRNVAWVAEEIAESVRGSLKACIGIETSEELKCMDAVLSVTRQLLEAGASRKALLVAIGGGITTDLAGFAASIYKRGIRYANVPTTLLSQVDAAIGGKNGVNLDGYKNMLGTITQPIFTFLCADVLRTLPPREFRCGVAEMLKTFLLADADAYAAAVRLLSTKNAQNLDGQSGELQELLLRAAEIKAGVVQRDPFEQGERAKLNLGHTFGHAIEHEAHERGEDIQHGEAVAIGIILAAEMSDREGQSNGLAARLKADFEAVGLPTDCPYPSDTLKAAMAKDKKAAGGKVKFILLRRPGEVIMKEISL